MVSETAEPIESNNQDPATSMPDSQVLTEFPLDSSDEQPRPEKESDQEIQPQHWDKQSINELVGAALRLDQLDQVQQQTFLQKFNTEVPPEVQQAVREQVQTFILLESNQITRRIEDLRATFSAQCRTLANMIQNMRATPRIGQVRILNPMNAETMIDVLRKALSVDEKDTPLAIVTRLKNLQRNLESVKVTPDSTIGGYYSGRVPAQVVEEARVIHAFIRKTVPETAEGAARAEKTMLGLWQHPMVTSSDIPQWIQAHKS